MGQGLYSMLAYGVLAPPQPADDDTNDALTNHLIDLGLRMAYETEPFYVVIPLAVDDAVLQKWWALPPLPGMLPHPQPRTARVLDLAHAPPGVVVWLAFQFTDALITTWKAAQCRYAAAGQILGEPSVIVLNDWD